MTEEMKEALREYLKENLSVRVDIGFDWGYNGRRIEVGLYLEGEEISVHTDSLPSND